MRRRSKNSACQIVISCDQPTEDGKMNVEMTCEGDEILAAFLLENAQSIINSKLTPSSKISSIGN